MAYPDLPTLMMMMMMMMDELTLTWHEVLRLQGHVTVKKESRIVDALVDCTSRDSCMSERKARSSVYHEKLAVMTKPETLSDNILNKYNIICNAYCHYSSKLLIHLVKMAFHMTNTAAVTTDNCF